MLDDLQHSINRTKGDLPALEDKTMFKNFTKFYVMKLTIDNFVIFDISIVLCHIPN